MPLEREVEKKLEIKRLRHEMDELDDKLLKLIYERREMAYGIARVKQELGSSMGQEERVKKQLARIEREAEDMGLDPKEIRALWKSLINYMIKEQAKKFPEY